MVKIPFWCVLHNDIKVAFIAERLVEFDYVRMIKFA